jgi:MOSC domain-containing protein YiiM
VGRKIPLGGLRGEGEKECGRDGWLQLPGYCGKEELNSASGLSLEEAGMKGQVIAISVSKEKGTRKHNINEAQLSEGHGIEGDAHAGEGHRQVSLLAVESIEKMKSQGLEVGPGDFAENLTTQGLDLLSLPIGTRLIMGRQGEVLLEVTQIGKVCHRRCAIYYLAGDCVMPREGIFVKVLRGGKIFPGDPIEMAGGSED